MRLPGARVALNGVVGVLVLLASWACAACGARSGLIGSNGSDADASAPPSCERAVPATSCAQAIAKSAAGTVVWKTSLDVGDRRLIGPVAADASATTYFVSAKDGLYVEKVFALDACGQTKWTEDVSDELFQTSGYIPQIFVSEARLVLVAVGQLVALSTATGDHVWTADITGFATSGGLGEPPGKVQALGYSAAASNGSVYTAVANDLDVWIVRVGATGQIVPVAKVPNYLTSIGYPLGAQQLVIDAAGNIVLAGAEGSGNGEGISAFAPDGSERFGTTLPSWGIASTLAAGPDFVTGRGLWILDLDGTLRNESVGGGSEPVWWDGPTVIDASGELIVVGARPKPGTSQAAYDVLGRFAADGSPRWSLTADASIFNGPLLGDAGHVFVLTRSESPMLSLTAYDVDTGAFVWREQVATAEDDFYHWLLVTNAGALVFNAEKQVTAVATGGEGPSPCAFWPTPRGGIDQRVAAFGR